MINEPFLQPRAQAFLSVIILYHELDSFIVYAVAAERERELACESGLLGN